MERISFSNSPDHALVAYLVKKYNDIEDRPPLGRTILQKLCYLAKARGVPLSLQFDIHHYGPFCAELLSVTGDLIADGVISDQNPDPSCSRYVPGPVCDQVLRKQKTHLGKNKSVLNQIIGLFGEMSAQELELITTIHYVSCATKVRGKSNRDSVVSTVFEIKKGKFSRQAVRSMFDELNRADLLTWIPRVTH
jgi:uncharacterized protein YwgA